MAKMSRRMPPTPVAAPWYGSTALGWLWDSILNTTARPSPMRDRAGVLARAGEDVGAVRWAACASSGRELLYEQCSLHMTLNMASSSSLGCAAQAVEDRVQLDVGQAEPAMQVRLRRESAALRRPSGRGHGRAQPCSRPASGRAACRRRSRGSASAARSGCGISPHDVAARRCITPAMSRSEPLGLLERSGRRPGRAPRARRGRRRR